MVRFAEVFPDSEIIATLSQQLSWSHFKELLPLEKPLQRDFYAEMCRVERWSVRTLRQKVDSMLYERQKEEDTPVGLILCAGKKHETVELLELEESSIRVAEYLTELPHRKLLEEKLHNAVEHARHRFENLKTQKGL
jgi:predicted nuclease of restriction endonuclease-like (RecB) superfamily